jgi:SNF2 family DNA or RNA helicase
LIKFLKHEPWCENGFWKAAITNASTKGNGDDEKISKTGSSNGIKNEGVLKGTNISLNRVKRLLAPLILRRTKDTLNKDG